MLKFKILLVSSFLLFSFALKAQTWCLSGTVTDAKTNETIPGAYIATSDLKNATATDADGYFKLCQLPYDSVELIVSHTAFSSQKIIVNRSQSTKNIKLHSKDYQAEEVTVTGKRNNLIKSYVPGKLSLKSDDILATPTILGSPDVVKSLQLLPGIQSVNEGNSGIYVRGGSPGQNYVLFDNIELMNPSHIMGIFSVFNPFLTNHVDFYKGNAPVHESGRLASSIIVSTVDQKNDNYNWAGNIGNISTNLSYQGKSKNDKWFFATGIRRSYIELLQAGSTLFISDEENYFNNNSYYFFDFNGKITYKYGKNKLKLSWYHGMDNFSMINDEKKYSGDSNWGNTGAALVWDRQTSSSSGYKTGIDYASYHSDFETSIGSELMYFRTKLHQWRYKFDYFVEKHRHFLRYGASLTYGHYTPQDLKYSLQNKPFSEKDTYNNLSSQLYLSDQFTISDKWNAYIGLRLEHYGLSDDKSLSEQSTHLNTVATLSYFPSHSSSVKASYAYTAQNIHLASIASMPLPTDVWMPATERLPHEKGHQLTLGYFKELTNKGFEAGFELYGKSITNQLLLNPNLNNDEDVVFEDNFFKGDGLGYGSEFLFRKTAGKTRGSLSYTLGWMQQQFPGINNGEWFNAKYDRRHDINFVITHKPNKRIDYGLVFMYATGNTATLPTGRYFMMGNIANDYSGVNNYRMPAYHRLDLSLNYHLNSNTFFESVLNFSIINIYNQSNPYFIYFETETGENTYDLSIRAKQSSFFPILPSISWRFKF